MKKFFALLLALIILLGLTACGNKIVFTIDENGYITWEPVKGAVRYECAMVDGSGATDEYFFLEEPGYQLQEGYCLHVCPVFENGKNGTWNISEYYGENKYEDLVGENEVYNSNDYVDINYDVRWDSLETFEVIAPSDGKAFIQTATASCILKQTDLTE